MRLSTATSTLRSASVMRSSSGSRSRRQRMLPLRTLAFVVQEPQEPARGFRQPAVLFGASDPSDFLVRRTPVQRGALTPRLLRRRGSLWLQHQRQRPRPRQLLGVPRSPASTRQPHGACAPAERLDVRSGLSSPGTVRRARSELLAART
eukprot:761227-Hanusia_phi.AAC.1